MDDGVVVTSEVIKRRLPPWMLGVAAAANKDGVGVSNNITDGNGGGEDEVKIKKCGGGGRRPKSKVAEKKMDDFCDGLEEESAALVVTERKGTKRKLNLDVEVVPKKKKKGQQGKDKKIIQIESSEEAVNGGCLENDDEDLTVEDLIIFAKECVQEDSSAQELEPMKEENSYENQNGNVVEENKRWSKEEETGSPSATTTSEGYGFKPSMSGDPTQDMLDLYLGPLLKKTREKAYKTDLTGEETDFDFEMKRQNTSSSGIGEEQATVTIAKKKTSLRDRVAMFLD